MAFIAPVVTGFSNAISGASVSHPSSVVRPRSSNVTMKMSPSMPFMEMPAALEDDTIVGNVGFDPLNFSETFDLKWMQEAEIKHCRVAMLGVVGYVLPELWRFPGVDPMSAAEAHGFFVKTGSMSQILLWLSFLEIFGVLALRETIAGNKPAGDFCFDPLGFSKNPETKKRYQLAELKNGRLAMCAIGGLFHANLISKTGILDQLAHFKGIPAHPY